MTGGDEAPSRALVLFTVGWAMACWFHMAEGIGGNPNLSHLLLAVGIGAALVVPGRAEVLLLLSVGGLWSWWDEAPEVSNHWTLAAMVNLAVLLAGAAALVRRRPDRLAPTLLPALRWVLLAFYCFAAFAKFNSAFFDPAVSCGTMFFERSVTSLGLDGLGLHDVQGVRWAVIVGTALVEASVPVLLLVRRTRPYGVLVAVTFHALLALDLDQQFTNFSSTLTALFLLFASPRFADGFLAAVAARWRGLLARVGLRSLDAAAVARVPAVLLALAVAAAELLIIDRDAVYRLAYLVWQPFVVVIVVALGRHLWRSRSDQPVQPVGRPPAWLAVVPALVVLNGVMPYLEVRNASTWSMYSNLRVVGGESNHFVVRAGRPLTDELSDPITILETDHPGLQNWADGGYSFAPQTLAYWLAQRPETAITYERRGEVVALDHAYEQPDLVDPGPELRRKLQFFTQVDQAPAQRCKW